MADLKHTGSSDPGNDAFDHFNHVLQDIREIREQHDSRLSPRLHARSAAAESESHADESLPLFLAGTDDQGWQPADQDPQQDGWPQVTWRQNTLLRETPQQAARRQDDLLHNASQDARSQDAWQDDWRQDDRQQDDWPPESRRDSWPRGNWLHAAAESDRERSGAAVAPTVMRRVLKAALVAVPVLGIAAAVFAMEGSRTLISSASASLAAVFPTLSSSAGQPAPANEQAAAIRVVPITTVAVPVAREATSVAPTREAIAVAYQSAVQSQPEIRQPAAPVLSVPPPRRIDPDELATLLKRAKDLINVGDIVSARLLLRRAADANEATAALILAQTYDPAVLGTADARSVAADPATARHWYEKAASFGSQEALQRLGQM
jgi:hypothetical protein